MADFNLFSLLPSVLIVGFSMLKDLSYILFSMNLSNN